MPIILSAPAKRRTNARRNGASYLPGGFHLSRDGFTSRESAMHYAQGENAASQRSHGLTYKVKIVKDDTGYSVYFGPIFDASKANPRRKNTRKAALPPMRNNGAVVDPMDIPCPVCGSSAGHPCYDGNTRKRFAHAARIDAADAATLASFARKAPAKRTNGSRTTTTKSVSVGDRVRVLPAYRHHDKKSAARWTGVVTEKYAGGDFSVEFSDGEEGVYKASEVSSVSARRNGSRSVVDPVAARELELYIENEASLIGPGNTLGANIMRMLAGRIVRGTYDGTKAWKAWVPLTTEGAKRYKREIGSLNASKATRDAVATRLSEAFESEVRSGALNPMKLLGK